MTRPGFRDARPSRTRRFLDAYRAAFEAFDVEAIADIFFIHARSRATPGGHGHNGRDSRGVVPQVDRLVSAYRAIGVRSAAFNELHAIELTSAWQVTVRWTLADVMGRSIYDFEASYSLADHGNGMRIAAIAHNEALRLRASRLLRAGSPMPSITDAAPRTSPPDGTR